MTKRITVFTPTYNRAYILEKCYQSLNAQTCKDFEWLIIDDGSTDRTRDMVKRWQQTDNGYEIRYVYKENGGLHTGYNAAIANMDTELSVCIDSDDAMPPNGIETILQHWDQVSNSQIAGLIGLDFDQNGMLIGKELPAKTSINPVSLLCVKGMGDKKYVVRNDLLKQVAPMPVFAGEKNFNPHYLIIKLSKNYRFVPINECFCEVEYQPDGMTANIFRQYVNSPNSFGELRLAILEHRDITAQYRIKTLLHYIASCLIAGKHGWLVPLKNKLPAIFLFPLGALLAKYIRRKAQE